jgi:ribonuclease Z
VALALIVWFLRPVIGERLFAAGVERNLNRDVIAELPDGLHVALCGTGSPLTDPVRAGPCTAIIAGKKLFIVDIGGGAVRRMQQMGLSPAAVEAVFLTHFHSDHIDGLGELALQHWAGGGHNRPLPVLGGDGLFDVVAGFNQAYAQDGQYRIAHHGAKVVPPSGQGMEPRAFALAGEEKSLLVYDEHGLKVTAFAVDHDPVEPAYGYRFDYGGRSVVLSGDTNVSANVENACRGCDILVHEALNADMVKTMRSALGAREQTRLAKIMADIPGYHTTPVGAAGVARRGKAKMLVLSHIVPPIPNAMIAPLFLKGAAASYEGPIILGEDGMLFSLPTNTTETKRGSLM